MGNASSTAKPDASAPSSSGSGGDGKSDAAAASSCPVPEAVRSKAVYNVYNQRIDGGAASSPLDKLAQYNALDPTNNMPREPNQQPFPGQRRPISTERQPSTIPKGGTDGTWLYPSPQMFYNALMRKGKGEDVTEGDMESVVYNHNVMNEMTWQRVLLWEQLHAEECGEPRLLRFQGRPDKLSPRARLRALFGDDTWFDRHDWYVERCGSEVRYVIDFYFDEAKADAGGNVIEAYSVDARPALDTPGAALDRTKMFIYKQFARFGLPCPVTGASGRIGSAAAAAADGGGDHQEQQ